MIGNPWYPDLKHERVPPETLGIKIEQNQGMLGKRGIQTSNATVSLGKPRYQFFSQKLTDTIGNPLGTLISRISDYRGRARYPQYSNRNKHQASSW